MLTDRTALNGRAGAQMTPAGMAEPPASLPIEQIAGQYPGEWVLVEVTARDAERGITHAQVLAHSRSRKKVSGALIKAHEEHPGILTYLFWGGPRAVTPEEWSEQLAAAAGVLRRRRKP